MASGVTHRKASDIVGAVTSFAVLYISGVTPFWFYALGAWIGKWITPDIDIHVPKPVQGTIFEVLKFMSPHRAGMNKKSWKHARWWRIISLSHVPIIGTLPRFVSVAIIIVPVLAIINPELIRYTVYVFAGMTIQDIIHVLLDTKFARLILDEKRSHRSRNSASHF